MVQQNIDFTREKEAETASFFGIKALKEHQRELITRICAGQSCLGVLPTGFGKSLCYQAAAHILSGITLVISPLLALMKEQTERLQQLGMAAQRFDSTLSDEAKRTLLEDVANGRVKLLFAAPESLLRPELSEALSHTRKSFFAIDEAHCISAWGHSFRPDYLKLPEWAKKNGFDTVMALTATAPPAVIDDLCRLFHISPNAAVIRSPRRANIERNILSVSPSEKAEVLHSFLNDPSHRPAIVYCRTRQGTEETADFLQRHGIAARAYHAGQPADVRSRIQADFLADEPDVMVATIAFGMGVDKANVRSVVHYDLPDCPEAYVQESGRAGRDGRSAHSLVLYHPSDAIRLQNYISAEEPSPSALLRCLRLLTPQTKRVVSYWEASIECDLTNDIIERCLSSLTEQGIIAIIGEGYKYYKAKPLFPLETICAGRNEDERKLFSYLAANPNAETEDLTFVSSLNWAEACDFLREAELSGEWKIELRQASVHLQNLHPNADIRGEAEKQSAYYSKRKKLAEKRLQNWLTLLHGKECLNVGLDAYFGFDQEEPCTCCSMCRKDFMIPLPYRSDITPPNNRELSALFSQKPLALARADQRARFLLGISSPTSRHARLRAHPAYASCEGMAWDDVLKIVQG